MSSIVQRFDPQDMERNPDQYFRRQYVWEIPVRITHW
jgi:hypothetical protein